MDGEGAKRAAGERAAGLVAEGMTVGLGTGTTTRWFIEALGRRVREGLRVHAVPTSVATATRAAREGIDLVELGPDPIDLAVDGADEVDPQLRMIKGRGGALVREKVVAAAARRFVVIVDESKLVDRLQGSVPVELLPFGVDATLTALRALGPVELRQTASGAPLQSDNHNLLADCTIADIPDPVALAARLDSIPGVMGHGLFVGLASSVLVGDAAGGVRELLPA